MSYTGSDGTAHTQEGGAVRGFSQEYDLRLEGDQSLENLAARTGGRVLTGEAGFWDSPVSPARGRLKLQIPLLVLALMLFLLDAALRRLPWEEALAALARRGSAKKEEKKAQSPPPKGPDRTQSQAAQDTASALLAAKRARRQK